MNALYSRDAIRDSVDFIARKTSLRPTAGLILGSGLAALASEVEAPTVIPYADVPHFAPCTVEGHPGELLLGPLQGCPVILMRGRLHFYEGYSIEQVTFPIRVMWGLGVKYLILTNAAGGLNPSYRAGDLMLITDHIGLSNMVGLNPLHGPNDPEIGPRFPDMSQVYDPGLRALALRAAADLGIPMHQGVYVMSSGPSFETPADLRFLRLIGADAVGMSTVPEATVAHHAAIRVLGISGITNVAHLQPSADKTSHAEVLEAGKGLAAKLAPLIRDVLRRLQSEAT
jgi:purine-nucleoside phosphorylase